MGCHHHPCSVSNLDIRHEDVVDIRKTNDNDNRIPYDESIQIIIIIMIIITTIILYYLYLYFTCLVSSVHEI